MMVCARRSRFRYGKRWNGDRRLRRSWTAVLSQAWTSSVSTSAMASLFVPEVLMAANAMKAGMAILRPLLTETGAERIGTLVIGTVKGDIHDIGKNLVAMMFEGAGFEVVNLGINVDADTFLAAIAEHKPDIIGMSALLTTTMPYMKVVVDTLGEEGIRDDIYVMAGGAPVTESFAREVGADAYGSDAAVSVEIAKAYMMRKREAQTA